VARRDDRCRPLDQFRLALAENCTMPEAAARLAARTDQDRLEAAKAAHADAMARLRAKGWRGRPPR
jgi:hypothetical protein